MLIRKKCCALTFAIVLALFGGCRDQGPERVMISGTVTYQGKQVADGRILFTPTATSQVPSAGASIVDGKYKVSTHGGVPVGTHRIAIEAYRRVPFTPQPGQPVPRNFLDGKISQQYLPKSCNTASKLEITVEPGSREITKNFDLTD
jgi:hypothetical protein